MRGLILAAGVGKRLAPLTDELPKGLLELGGRSLLARLLDGLATAGVGQTAIVVGHRHEAIRAAFRPDDYLPEELHGRSFYVPGELGDEREIARRVRGPLGRGRQRGNDPGRPPDGR